MSWGIQIMNDVNNILTELDEKTDLIFTHQMLMGSYQSIPRDYGTGLFISETEAHALLYIKNNPGITAKRVGEIMNRTKGTISLIIGFLENNELIRHKVNPSNKRERLLYVTEKGQNTCEKHLAYDRKMTSDILLMLLQYCNPEEVNGFFKVLSLRIKYFQEVIAKEKEINSKRR